MTRRELLIGVAMLAILPLAGGPAAAAGARTHRIEMRNMRFGPVPANIKAGDTIVWVNRDIVPHTATARDRSFDVVVPSRGSATTGARRAGTIAFYCRYHPAMRGSLAIAR
jgi:plastocyanin